MTAQFPDRFVFGASTASYQIEGAWDEDGKGETIWDRFTHTPGKIADGTTGDVACDHYHRFEEDLDLAAGANMDVYRFSISWARLFPQGTGERNEAGFDFYKRLVDACLERGIEPWPCFYHWDLPQALQDKGGWTNRASIGWYADYAEAAARSLADSAAKFVMFNEPGVFVTFGYQNGHHAPGVSGMESLGAAMHHVNMATAEGARRVREAAPGKDIGTVLAKTLFYPESDSEADKAMADFLDAHSNTAYADPLFFGRYPEPAEPTVADFVQDGDLESLRTKLDFVGINHYMRWSVKAGEDGRPELLPPPESAPKSEMGWEIWPEGLKEVLVRFHKRYGDIPLYVTENGMAAPDTERTEDGRIADHDRIDFLRGYIGAARDAMDEGVDLRGYLVWTLMDNFEWAEGNAKRFGIVETDYETLERRPKLSYDWFAELAKKKAIPGS